jgi:DNA repair ATPase RecN
MAMETDPFDVSVAQYFLDSAGFHGMAEALADTKTIDATYLSTVNRVKRVVEHTVWPEELHEQAQAFSESLGTFAAALEADNIDDAIAASDTVHDAQHELSHSIDHWMADVMATASAADPFKVSVSQFFLDSTGFHGMAETLADTKTIDPTYLSKVTRVKKVLDQTAWPAELNEQSHAFSVSLESFAAALEADDVDKAVEISETVHDAQHELSHSIDHWMETAQPISADADPFDVSVAQYFLDSAGFHGMAERLADTKTIDPAYLSTVNRVKKVLAQTAWPADLNDQAQAFITSLSDFATALSDNKVDDAISLSETVHDAQHELSHAIDHWAGADAENH